MPLQARPSARPTAPSAAGHATAPRICRLRPAPPAAAPGAANGSGQCHGAATQPGKESGRGRAPAARRAAQTLERPAASCAPSRSGRPATTASASASSSSRRSVRAAVATSPPPSPSRSPSPPASPRLPRGSALPSLEDLRPADASVVSAVALILGSTIGAGILALPAVGAPAGFGPSAAVLAGVCAALTAEALLIAEVNLAVLAERRLGSGGGGGGDRASGSTPPPPPPPPSDDDIATLRDMAAATLGPRGGAFVSTAYLALSYALLTAYVSKAGDLLALSSSSTTSTGAVAFVAATGAVLFAGTGAVDSVNRVMTAGLLLLYGGIVAAGASSADWASLTTADWGAAPAAIPVVLLALVYHDLVPVVCAQLRGDVKAVRTALMIGSAAPLLMFVAWDGVALALSGGGGGGGGGGLAPGAAAIADPLDAVMALGGPAMRAGVAGFSLLAIATSCLGTSLGLSQTVIAELRGTARAWLGEGAAAGPAAPSPNPLARLLAALGAARLDGEEEGEEEAGGAALLPAPLPLVSPSGDLPGLRALAFALVLGPPLAAALANPGSFFSVLNAVGGYGMTALYGVLPPLMAWRLRERQAKRQEREGVPPSPQLLPGGRPVLASLCAGAVAVEAARLADDLGSAMVRGEPTATVGAALADLAAAGGGAGWVAGLAEGLGKLI